MNTSIANVVFLIVGFASAYHLMQDTTGAFSPQKAEGIRWFLGFFLCLFGGWFTSSKYRVFHPIDLAVLAILVVLAVIALRYPPIA